MLGSERLIAHQQARTVNRPRGRQICSSCSVNTLPKHAGSRHRQVRFRQSTWTGRPKHGASTIATVRRPWLAAITPHRTTRRRRRRLDRQPIRASDDLDHVQAG
jgi:hypothetical protein